MNVAIMVSCATSLPQFTMRTKMYLHSTTSSLRKRFMTMRGSRNVSRKSSNELRTQDLELDSYLELRDFPTAVAPATGVHSTQSQNHPREPEVLV